MTIYFIGREYIKSEYYKYIIPALKVKYIFNFCHDLDLDLDPAKLMLGNICLTKRAETDDREFCKDCVHKLANEIKDRDNKRLKNVSEKSAWCSPCGNLFRTDDANALVIGNTYENKEPINDYGGRINHEYININSFIFQSVVEEKHETERNTYYEYYDESDDQYAIREVTHYTTFYDIAAEFSTYLLNLLKKQLELEENGIKKLCFCKINLLRRIVYIKSYNDKYRWYNLKEWCDDRGGYKPTFSPLWGLCKRLYQLYPETFPLITTPGGKTIFTTFYDRDKINDYLERERQEEEEEEEERDQYSSSLYDD